ncbi:MAG: penicillin-binding transpeptidase domain-containing protein [Faecousia sp.]
MGKKSKSKQYSRIRLDSGHHKRILASAVLLGLLGFVPVVMQLYNLMVSQNAYYRAQALRNQGRTTNVMATRGDIYDRNMNVLATSRTVENVYLDPQELRQSRADLDLVANTLGEILGKDKQKILTQAKDLTRRYQQVAAAVDSETAEKIRDFMNTQQISGIHLEPSSQRVYPYETMAAQVIGFVNTSGTGSEGLEAKYDSYLQGTAGKVTTTKGNNEMDMPFSYENYRPSETGCSLVLTLDTTVQACLEKQMQAAIDRYDVKNGAFGMVMNVNTGEILAMATLGSFDPNNYLEIQNPQTNAELQKMEAHYLSQIEGTESYDAAKKAYKEALYAAQLKQWRNRCISDGYEPGSTFKVLTMAAALDCGAITLDTNFYCKGSEQIPGRSQLLHCWRSTGHGAEKTPQALQNSCNIAFAHIALKMGGERFYDYVQRFGILEKTGIDLAGESKGVFFDKALVTDTDKWGTASLTSGSFGQTFKLTPIQLVRAIASVVNGGNLMEPYLVSEVLDSEGNVVYKQEPQCIRTTISPETSKTMCQLLRSVVAEGTAKNASVSGYCIGGKTGTSEKIDIFDENGQRVLDKIVSFVGVAPMENPQYIVLVALDTPSRETGIYISGGVMAAPTVGAVMADILPYLGVEKTVEEEAAAKAVIMPDFQGMTVAEAEKQLKKLGLTQQIRGSGDTVTDQLPQPGETVPGGSKVLLYTQGEAEEAFAVVPDFSGMTRQQAGDAAMNAGLYILVAGNTDIAPDVKAMTQSIAPGTQVPKGTTVRIEFTDTKAN